RTNQSATRCEPSGLHLCSVRKHWLARPPTPTSAPMPICIRPAPPEIAVEAQTTHVTPLEAATSRGSKAELTQHHRVKTAAPAHGSQAVAPAAEFVRAPTQQPAS